jgi:hypothetical protein
MAVLLAPFGYCRQAPAEPVLHRPRVHCELPSPAACANVREAEEIRMERQTVFRPSRVIAWFLFSAGVSDVFSRKS